MANNLPTVSSPLPRDLQQFVQRVREALDGGGADAVVTARQLIATGLVAQGTTGDIAPIAGTVETARAPSNLTASGALASIIVSWNAPTYKGHSYTEIWAHTSDVIGDAVLVGMTAGNNFSHNIGGSATRYYWVRNVNRNGGVSAFNATNGTQGTTGQDAAYLLSVLTGEITASNLANSLSTRIDLVDAADTVSGSVNARIKTEADPLKAQYTVKIDNDGYVSGFGLASENVNGDIVSEFIIRSDRFSIINPSTAKVSVYSTTAEGSIAAGNFMWIQFGYQTAVPSGFNIGDSIVFLNHPDVDSTQSYTIVDNTTISGNTPINSSFPALKIVNDGELNYLAPSDASNAGTKIAKASIPFIVDSGNVIIDTAIIKDASITQAKLGTLTADVINSGLLNTVDFYGNKIAGSDISLGGTVNYNTDSDGNNIGISSISNPAIQLRGIGIAIFDVNSFYISNGGNGNGSTPFQVVNNNVYIKTAFIEDGTITDAKIANTIQSTNYSGSAGWKIEKSGNAEFNSGTFRGTLDVANASSGDRLKISSTKIEVYDGSTLRVKIGDLS